MYKTCQKLIWWPKGQDKSNTYCMRPEGHEAECATEVTEEDKKTICICPPGVRAIHMDCPIHKDAHDRPDY